MVVPQPLPATVLAWDSESKDYDLKQGEMQAQFTFYFTNISTTNVVINSALASCGCTVPKMPQLPWTNAPGATGEIPVTMQLAGKSGVVWKTITVNTDQGQKVLTVKAVIQPPSEPRRHCHAWRWNKGNAGARRQRSLRPKLSRCPEAMP